MSKREDFAMWQESMLGFRFWIFAGRRPVAGFVSRDEADAHVRAARPGLGVRLRVIDTDPTD